MLSLSRSTMFRWLVPATLLWLQLVQPVATAEVNPAAAWHHLLERGWFSLARQAADTAAAQQAIDETVRLVDQSRRQRTAWLEQADRWQQVWQRPEATAFVSQTDRLVAWGSRHGLQLVRLGTGRPVWGDGAVGGGPLFPRLRPAMQAELPLPGRPGPVALAAGRLVGLVDRTVAGSSAGPLLAALDLAPAAEGRLVWASELPPDLPPPAAGLAVTSAACFVAWPDAAAATLELISLAAADGGLQWRRSLPLPAGFDRRLDGPVRVACVQHLVVVALPGGWLVGLAADTGRECWRTTVPAGAAGADSGIDIDALAATADGLIAVRRPAAGHSGQLEICRFDLLSGILVQRHCPFARAAVPAARESASSPPQVCGGHVVWPVSQPPAEPATRLLVCRLPVGPAATAGSSEDLSLNCQSADIVAAAPAEPAVADREILARRLVVNTGRGLWCLEPAGGEPARVQSNAD